MAGFYFSHKIFGVAIQIRRERRKPDRLDAYALKNRIKLLGVFFIPIVNDVFFLGEFTIIGCKVSGGLRHPFVLRIRSDAGNNNLAGFKMNEKEDVIRYETERRPDLSGEEITCPHNIARSKNSD